MVRRYIDIMDILLPFYVISSCSRICVPYATKWSDVFKSASMPYAALNIDFSLVNPFEPGRQSQLMK